MAIPTTALATPFTRKGLRCNRMVLDYPDRPEMEHWVVWVVGGPAGCITLNMSREKLKVLPHPFALRINGERWLPLVVARHTPRPIYDYDTECGPCMYLDGLPCHGDSSGMLAADILGEAVECDSEDFIWDVLIEVYHTWIEERIHEQADGP